MPIEDDRIPRAKAPPGLWEKLKPLVRQKRHEPTPAENALWQCIRNRQLGMKFRRQHAIERFIVDFYCAEKGIIVEVDGAIHEYTVEDDAIRQEYLQSLGLRVIRFTNDEVMHHMDVTLERLRNLTP